LERAELIGIGFVFIIIAFIAYNYPLSDTTMGGQTISVTIPQAVGICNSAMGQLGQAYSVEAVKTCSEYNMLIIGIYGSGLLGIILIIVGVVKKPKHTPQKSSQVCEYCNYIPKSEIDFLEHNAKNHLDKSPYKCEHCDFIGITEEILWNHYNDNHPDKKKWKWN